MACRDEDSDDLMQWRVRGSYFEACNCDAICPCRSVRGAPGGPSTSGVCFGTLSWHVQVLESCGVVRTEKVGRTRMCRIERGAITAAEQWITDRRRGWETRLDRLGDVLHEEATTEEQP